MPGDEGSRPAVEEDVVPAEAAGRPPWVRRVAVVGILLGAAGASYAFARSPFFALKSIRVAGIRHISQERVVREAGLAEGENVLWLDAGAMEVRLERDPWIETATVARSLPRGVTVQIVERSPVAAIERGGIFEIVAADGVTLTTAGGAPGLPVIRSGGEQRGAIPTGPLAALAALDPKTRAEVRVASTTGGGMIVLRLLSGTRVVLGGANDLQDKASALGAVLTYERAHHVRFVEVDVRYPGAPRARLPGGSSVRV